VIGLRLQPLVDALQAKLLQSPVLHADETPVAQLDPGAGKTKRAYLFAYRNTGEKPVIVFDYCPSRAGKHAASFLGDWNGALMVDDYGGYKALFARGITELACWAHARRKFFDAHQASGSPIAQEAVRRIGEIYAVEAKLRDLDDDTRTRERRNHLAPKLDALKRWLDDLSPKVLGNSGLATAVGYTLKRWSALARVLDDGSHPIGRVEMWRGGGRFGISVAASFDRRCLTVRTLTPFPHPAHRTVRADFPHTALFQCIRPFEFTAPTRPPKNQAANDQKDCKDSACPAAHNPSASVAPINLKRCSQSSVPKNPPYRFCRPKTRAVHGSR